MSRKHFAFAWAQELGPAECPWMRRWKIRTPLGALHVHHFLRSSIEHVFHDHPWWFLTIVLAGGYTDVSLEGDREVRDELRRGSIRFRPARHRHRTETAGAWTLVVVGRSRRESSFWTNARGLVERHLGSVDPASCDEVRLD